MEPSIRLRCPGCNARIKAPWELIGRWRDCPGCSHRFVVQFKLPQDSDPVLVLDDRAAVDLHRP